MSKRDSLNLSLRVLMEAGVVAAFAYWGVHTGSNVGTKVLYGIAAPAIGFGFWGAVDFHQAGRYAEPVRLIQELSISGLASVACYSAGRHRLGIALALLSIVYHALVYASGTRLLKAAPGRLAADPTLEAGADDRLDTA